MPENKKEVVKIMSECWMETIKLPQW